MYKRPYFPAFRNPSQIRVIYFSYTLYDDCPVSLSSDRAASGRATRFQFEIVGRRSENPNVSCFVWSSCPFRCFIRKLGSSSFPQEIARASARSIRSRIYARTITTEALAVNKRVRKEWFWTEYATLRNHQNFLATFIAAVLIYACAGLLTEDFPYKPDDVRIRIHSSLNNSNPNNFPS